MSENEAIIGLASLVVLGVGAQWIARRIGFPSILLLLPAGLLAGNGLDVVDPEALFGDTLFPLVTLLVALLLFNSGLELRLENLPGTAFGPVVRLITVGALITFIGASVAVDLTLDLGTPMVFLTGAILVVSGPTVVGPLLSAVRAREPTASILRWEGTTLDPIGATLGVVVLNLVLAADRGGMHPVLQMSGRLAVGVAAGVIAAGLLVLVMSRFLLTDDMEAAVAVFFAVAAFAAAEVLMSEAGLFATVALGIVVANQRIVPLGRIAGFGETLEVLIIGVLFILLGALVDIGDLQSVALPVLGIVAILVLIVRPLSVGVALFGSVTTVRDRALIALIDPRGIVAAATAAQFTGVLTTAGIVADDLLAVVFGVILGTGVVYGLAAPAAARALGVTRDPEVTVALVGDEPWLWSFARALQHAGGSVLVITSEPPEELALEHREVPWVSMIESDARVDDALDQAQLGQVLVAAPPAAMVSLVAARLIEQVGRRNVIRLPTDDAPAPIDRRTPRAAHPAHRFGGGRSAAQLQDRFAHGGAVEVRTERPGTDDEVLLATVHPDGTAALHGREVPVVEGSRFVVLVSSRESAPAQPSRPSPGTGS